jgi:FdhD protein
LSVLPHPKQHHTTLRWRDGRLAAGEDSIAEETPVALVYNGMPYVVMMATPGDLEDFVLGFSLSEGIIGDSREFHGVRLRAHRDGVEADISIAQARFVALDKKRRNLTGRIGCGLCGAQTLAQAIRRPSPVPRTLRFAPESLERALAELPARQRLNAETGAVHAAAWLSASGAIALVREDVGRHNALDKLIGAMVAQDLRFGTGIALLTSRASYEMIQKAATVGIQAVCAISAPTSLAVRLAEECGVTLVAFARAGRHTVYAHEERCCAAGVQSEAA